MSDSGLKANHLRCEHRCSPLGVDATQPRLSWVMESEGRGQKQSAYQILVAESEKDLQNERDLLWDSGKVTSYQTIDVVYAGRRLSSGMRCYWKVRIWDESDEPSPYSEVAMWGMGLLEKSDWMGGWVDCPWRRRYRRVRASLRRRTRAYDYGAHAQPVFAQNIFHRSSGA